MNVLVCECEPVCVCIHAIVVRLVENLFNDTRIMLKLEYHITLNAVV